MFDIVVTIVSYNTKSHLEKCLDSLFKDIEKSKLNIRVVVVDNASSDGSNTMLVEKYPQVDKIFLQENCGFGKAQNIAIKSIRAKYYFILNPDTYFFEENTVIKSMYEFMEKEQEIGVIGPKIVYPDGSLQMSCCRFPTILHPFYTRTRMSSKKGKKYQNYLFMKDVEHDQPMPVDWVMGSAMFIRANVFDRVGFFDERFWMYYEDSDLCRSAWEKNIPVYYYPEVKIEHVHRRSSADEANVIKALVKNKIARVHIMSWIKYMWKWRGNINYYSRLKI